MGTRASSSPSRCHKPFEVGDSKSSGATPRCMHPGYSLLQHSVVGRWHAVQPTHPNYLAIQEICL